jgi:serine/threonine-protein kinase
MECGAELRGSGAGVVRIPRDLLPLVRQALGTVYRVEREIGRGGAAVVYYARAADGTPVALKVLRPELAVTVTAQRFLQEIRFVSTLDHPHIGRLLDSGERDWLVYYVMPYLEGLSLQQHLERFRHLPLDQTLRLARELLDALAHAHERGIVHRDVKPDNIMLTPAGAVLVDFGIARAIALSGQTHLTRSGMAVGTSTYMSPEQISAAPAIDHRSDLYSLGCVLFQCLAGRPPFVHRSEAAVLHLHLTEPAPDVRTLVPGLPSAVAVALARALCKAPEERWPSALAMRAALADST